MNKEKIEKIMWKSKILGTLSEEEKERIDKLEIEESNKCLDETIQNTYAERKAIKLKKLRQYMEKLEFENTALKVEHNHNIDKIKELKQKETILDKVTEECRKQMTANEDTILEIFSQKLLNIIEGEKNNDYSRN